MHNYFYTYYDIEVGLCRDGYELTWEGNSPSFLLDDAVKGIALRLQIERCDERSINDAIVEKITLSLYKEKDCKELRETDFRYHQWKREKGDVPGSIRMNQQSRMIMMNMYEEYYEELKASFGAKAVCRTILDYSMPAGVRSEAKTLVLPVDVSKIEADTVYRITARFADELETSYSEDPKVTFFKSDKPAAHIFQPTSASLVVRRKVYGKLTFDKAAKYRHYNNFNDDIHYDDDCGGDTMINPLLVCFNVEAKGFMRKRTENIPMFTLRFSSGGKTIVNDRARVIDKGNGKLLIFAKLYEEIMYKIEDSGNVEAALRVFATTIAKFTFNTHRLEKGEYLREEII